MSVCCCAQRLQARGVAVRDERVQALREVTEPWQREVVNPLRSLRQQWRAAAQNDAQLAALREQVKGLELQAEKALLERLQERSRQWPAGAHEPVDDWLARLVPDQPATTTRWFDCASRRQRFRTPKTVPEPGCWRVPMVLPKLPGWPSWSQRPGCWRQA